MTIVVLACLAVFRLTWLFMYDAGPFRILAKARHRLGVGRAGEVSFWDGLLTCPYCLGFWISPFVTTWVLLDWDSARFVIWPLAVGGAAALLHEAVGFMRGKE